MHVTNKRTSEQANKRSRKLSVLSLAALAVLSLSAQPAAHAQTLTLNSGDAITVDGTGTHGTISGSPVSNITASYSETSAGYAVGTYGTSTFTLGNGGMLSGTSFSGDGMDAHGSGSTVIKGGTLNGGFIGYALNSDGTDSITISGGTFNGGIDESGLNVSGSGKVTITGGTFNGQNSDGFTYSGSGLATISGGTFGARYGGVGNSGSGTVIISGGTFSGDSGIETGNVASTIDVIGGMFNASFVGNGFGGFFTDAGTINLFSQGGTPFLINGVAMNNTSLPVGTSGTISGILLNGQPFSTTYSNYEFSQFGTINLNVGTAPAPEPSQFAALGIGFLGLGTLLLRTHKRRLN